MFSWKKRYNVLYESYISLLGLYSVKDNDLLILQAKIEELEEKLQFEKDKNKDLRKKIKELK